MDMAWKAINKAERMAATNDAFYCRMRERVLRHPAELPASDETVAILESASSRPKGGLKVGLKVQPRMWPEEPEVDVSVIVPCYNVGRLVEDCVCSVTSQGTSHSFEVICVDDGSTDSTSEILDSLAGADDCIRVLHQSNRGFSGARNAGIAKAHGGRLMFVDSDDLVLPGAIETLCDAFDEGGCDYVTASYMDLSEDGRIAKRIDGKRQHGAPWGRLYSREIWRHLEFPEGFWFEDTIQSFCIAPRWREKYIDIPVYEYRQNGSGITANAGGSKKSLDTLWIVDELLEWDDQLGIHFNQEMYDRVIWQFGILMLARTSALAERERRAMFAYACDILNQRDSDKQFATSRGGAWKDVELGLRTYNYGLWKMAAMRLMG